jgi:hypothetical protein
LGVYVFSISRVLLRPKRQVGHKQISGVLIGVRKGERDAKVQKTAQHLLGPEITGAACPVSAPRRVRYCEHWSLLVRAWMTSRGSVGPKVTRGWTVIIRRNVCGSRRRSSSGVGARFLPGWASLRGVSTRWCDWRTEWWKLSDSRESWVLRKLRVSMEC